MLDAPSSRNASETGPHVPDADAGARSAVESQRRLEGIIRSATEAIITIDESQTILIFNPMAERLFACSATAAIGTSLDRFIPLRYRAAHAQQVQQFGVTGVTERQMGKRLPLFGLRADGTEFPIEASISQFVERHGASDGEHGGNRRLYTVMLRDITAQVNAEAALHASRNELRQLSASIQTAREEEQSRIARELHDDLGQRLTALKMDVSLLEAELEEWDGAAAAHAGSASGRHAIVPSWRQRTVAMRRLIDDTVQAVRTIAADLRPVMLDDLGLVAAIEWLANEWRGRYGIVVTVTADAEPWAIKPAAATAIFRIVQEALTNIARHANATRATVSLRRYDGAPEPSYRVQIADNGVGRAACAADAAHAVGRMPFGLIGMRERATLMGGTLALTDVATERASVAASDAMHADVTARATSCEVRHEPTHEPTHEPSHSVSDDPSHDSGFIVLLTIPCTAIAAEHAV